MKIFVPREADKQETRVSLLPAEVAKLIKLGAQLHVETGIGQSIRIPDSTYQEEGAGISNDRKKSLASADKIGRAHV